MTEARQKQNIYGTTQHDHDIERYPWLKIITI